MKDTDCLRVHRLAARTRALGPFERFALWTQGCAQRCPGCVTPEAQPLEGGRLIPVKSLAGLVLSEPGIEGITISGGEPFLQAPALVSLLMALKEVKDLGVIVYTGLVYEALRFSPDPAVPRLLSMIDLLVDGPYLSSRNDGRPLRGSANQRALALSGRYKACLPAYGGPGEREMEWQADGDGLFMVGIPTREFLTALEGQSTI